MSPPSRGRGLKHPPLVVCVPGQTSPPMRGRGLKHLRGIFGLFLIFVPKRLIFFLNPGTAGNFRSACGVAIHGHCMRGHPALPRFLSDFLIPAPIKQSRHPYLEDSVDAVNNHLQFFNGYVYFHNHLHFPPVIYGRIYIVAPFTGAWIETFETVNLIFSFKSFPKGCVNHKKWQQAERSMEVGRGRESTINRRPGEVCHLLIKPDDCFVWPGAWVLLPCPVVDTFGRLTTRGFRTCCHGM